LMLKAGKTSREAARRAIRGLLDVKARLFGAIINDIDLNSHKYGYYYYSRYGYYYGAEEAELASTGNKAG
jgi:polysaccharide biosynthesis transport protein